MKNYPKEREGEKERERKEAQKEERTAKVVTSGGSLDLRLCHPDVHPQDSAAGGGRVYLLPGHSLGQKGLSTRRLFMRAFVLLMFSPVYCTGRGQALVMPPDSPPG